MCNLLNFTESSVSSSDCSLDWQRNRTVNQLIAPEPCPPSWHSWPLSQGQTSAAPPPNSGHQHGTSVNLHPRFIEATHTLGWPNIAENQTFGLDYRKGVHPISPLPESSRAFSPSRPCNSSYTAVVWTSLSSVWPTGTRLSMVINHFSKPKILLTFSSAPSPTKKKKNQNQQAERGKQ